MTGISWNRADARRGLCVAAPALPIAAVANVSLGVVFALGTLPVAMLGLPPTRRARLKLIAVGILFAGSYAAGSVIGNVPLLAIAAMFVVAGGSTLVAPTHHKAAALLPALATPAFALGMNHPAPDGFKLAAMFLAGVLLAALLYERGIGEAAIIVIAVCSVAAMLAPRLLEARHRAAVGFGG
jgi:hypothetical protein